MTPWSGKISKTPARFRDYVCSEVRNQITQELTSHTGTHWTPAHSEGELTPLAVALGYQQRREFPPFISENWRETDTTMNIEATLN